MSVFLFISCGLVKGEALAVVCLLSALIKGKGRLTIQFRGKGKLKLLLAQCDHLFNLRGLVQYEDELSQNELWEAQQQGTLGIMIDSDLPNTSQYQGIVAWQGKTLSEAIEGYFAQSEQLPTRLWLAVDETSVAGLLLQMLPKEKEDSSTKNDWEHLTILANTVKPSELLNLPGATLLHRLYAEEDIRLFKPASVAFRCTCTLQRFENAILVLGQQEAEEELKGKDKLTVTCEFCNKEYIFDRVDVAEIFKRSGPSTSSKQIH
jgi:molecular chaperone Hsp33